MANPATIDWLALWKLATARFALGGISLHGPKHWQQVERNGLELAAESGADEMLVRLFAVLHDSCRQNESHDSQHGPRAAAWAAELRGTWFTLDDTRFDRLTAALAGHDRGTTSEDPTIGTCWDADRLDLIRVGIQPDPAYMSTAAGQARARRGWPFVR